MKNMTLSNEIIDALIELRELTARDTDIVSLAICELAYDKALTDGQKTALLAAVPADIYKRWLKQNSNARFVLDRDQPMTVDGQYAFSEKTITRIENLAEHCVGLTCVVALIEALSYLAIGQLDDAPGLDDLLIRKIKRCVTEDLEPMRAEALQPDFVVFKRPQRNAGLFFVADHR